MFHPRKVSKKKVILSSLGLLVFITIGAISYHFLDYYNLIPKKSHSAEEFSVTTIHSSVDYNNNNVDDYTDFLLGARKDAENHPTYESAYYNGGYPPDNIGVCTDVIWRAFKNAGYCLKDMVNNDIMNNIDAYPRVNGSPDPNIDFRRVPNLQVFFERNAISLTLDTSKIDEWQPGDIIVFSNTHVGILSDKRNSDGIPYLIHNAGQPNREEDALLKQKEITGHYRFDASKVDESILVPFTE